MRRSRSDRSLGLFTRIFFFPFIVLLNKSIRKKLEDFISDERRYYQVDLSSLTDLTMAHILVRRQQQQQPLRSSSISIHRTTSTEKNSEETTLPMTHSVDDRLFLYKHESTRLLHLLTRFASEPQIGLYTSSSSSINGHFNKNNDILSFGSTCLSKEADDLNFEDLFHFNCEKIASDQFIKLNDFQFVHQPTDLGSAPVKNPVEDDDEKENLHDDINPVNNESDNQHERPLRRRKRRSSFSKSSPTAEQTVEESQTPDTNENKNSDWNETLSNDNVHANSSEETPIENSDPSDEKSTLTTRFRGRRLRHRLHRQTEAINERIDESSEVLVELNEQNMNIDSERIINQDCSSPVLQPASHELPEQPKESLHSSGVLKRVSSLGKTAKKSVHFADSVGLELTQVQYIRSNNFEESKDFSMLLGSSLLSSSPPSFSKNSLYLPYQSHFEHKPWSFDVAPSMKQCSTSEKPVARRFFCLFRQPSSEPADIYLHEIWKHQIKLERAEIPVYQSSTGDQYLVGTVWVSNIGFVKNVSIKYTFNRWLNTYEHEALHRRNSNDHRNIDQFEFHVDVPADVDRIDFVLRYSVNGKEYWDNNDEKNYTIQTESNYASQTKISLPHDCDFNEMRFY